jgi:hypothetical protein
MSHEIVEPLATRAGQLLATIKDGESRAYRDYQGVRDESDRIYLAEWDEHNTWYRAELPRAALVSNAACEALLEEWTRRMFASYDANEARQCQARAALKTAWDALQSLRLDLADARAHYRAAGGTESLD